MTVLAVCNKHEKNHRSIFIAGDHANFLAGLTLLSKSMTSRDTTVADFDIEPKDKIHLDPGGMLNIAEPWIDFKVPSGAVFSIQASKTTYVLDAIALAEGSSTVVPGWRRFRNGHLSVAIPETDYHSLLESVRVISESSDALNYSLDMEEALDELEKGGHLVRVRTSNEQKT